MSLVCSSTDKSLSEALIFAEHVLYINCSECQNQFLYTTCSPHVLSLEFSRIELVIQWTILWVSWCKEKLWQRFTCNAVKCLFLQQQPQCHRHIVNIIQIQYLFLVDYPLLTSEMTKCHCAPPLFSLRRTRIIFFSQSDTSLSSTIESNSERASGYIGCNSCQMTAAVFRQYQSVCNEPLEIC